MGCFNSCVVQAPVDTVWSVLRNCHDMSWAPHVVQKVDRVGEATAHQIGARRILNGVFHETLLGLSDTDRELKYSIDDGPGPVAKDQVHGYLGAVRVSPVTDGNATFVEWSSSWQDSKGGVKECCDPIYKALLDSLKKHFAASR